jgi:hypothetical protein
MVSSRGVPSGRRRPELSPTMQQTPNFDGVLRKPGHIEITQKAMNGRPMLSTFGSITAMVALSSEDGPASAANRQLLSNPCQTDNML